MTPALPPLSDTDDHQHEYMTRKNPATTVYTKNYHMEDFAGQSKNTERCINGEMMCHSIYSK